MKFEELEILDVEETKEGDKLKVVFEVPGTKFNQNYPERLTHTFPKKPFYTEKMENGNRRYEEKLRKIYIDSDEDKQKRKKVDNELEDLKKECRNKKLGKQ